MTFLLDTNVVSELRKAQRCHPAVAAWNAIVAPRDTFISVLVIGEVRRGIERLRRRDAATASVLEEWRDAIVAIFSGRILPVTEEIAHVWGYMGVPDPISPVDGLMAATALVHDLTLVTRDMRGVARTGVRTLNPFLATHK